MPPEIVPPATQAPNLTLELAEFRESGHGGAIQVASVTIRVLSSHPVASAQYTRVLEKENDFYLTSTTRSAQVGIFDDALPSLDAALALARLQSPTMHAVLVCSSCDENDALHWLLEGVRGIVPYERYEQDLPRAVRQVADGQLWFPATVISRWMQIDRGNGSPKVDSHLTPREQEVAGFVMRRLSNKEIASLLRISERTVKFHIGNIFTKMHIHSRSELVRNTLQ